MSVTVTVELPDDVAETVRAGWTVPSPYPMTSDTRALHYLAKAIPPPPPEFKVGQVWRDAGGVEWFISILTVHPTEFYASSSLGAGFALRGNPDATRTWTLAYDPEETA